MKLDEVDDHNKEGKDKEQAPCNHAEVVEGVKVDNAVWMRVIAPGGGQAESETAEEQSAEPSH